YADAEADLERALALEKDFPHALLHRGFIAMAQKNTEKAMKDFEAVLNLSAEKRLILAAYYRGVLYKDQRKFPEALADFKRVTKEAPTFQAAYLLRAQVYLLQDDPRALGELTTYLELGMPKGAEAKPARLFALRGRLLRHLVPILGLTKEQT